MNECDGGGIDLSMFNEDDPREHQMKLLFGCGIMFGFRGSDEHTNLEVRNITRGDFASGHPYAGYEYYGIEGLTDKTLKLTSFNSHVRDNTDYMRLPVMDDDPTSSDLPGSFKRFLTKLAPGQIRIYCKVLPPSLRSKDGPYENQFFYPNNPLGRNTINQLFKDGARILGLSNPDSFSPHSLRAYFITRLANTSGVSDKERMVASRHNSVAASAIYQERDSNSEVNRFSVLGIKAATVQEE